MVNYSCLEGLCQVQLKLSIKMINQSKYKIKMHTFKQVTLLMEVEVSLVLIFPLLLSVVRLLYLVVQLQQPAQISLALVLNSRPQQQLQLSFQVVLFSVL